MVCPYCLHTKTKVYNSRGAKKFNAVWRRRRCLKCKNEFTTNESINPGSVIKVNGAVFSYAKLLISILAVCDHRKDQEIAATYLTDTIIQTLYPIAAAHHQKLANKVISEQALTALKNYDLAAYVKYLSYHSAHLDTRSIKRRLGATS